MCKRAQKEPKSPVKHFKESAPRAACLPRFHCCWEESARNSKERCCFPALLWKQRGSRVKILHGEGFSKAFSYFLVETFEFVALALFVGFLKIKMRNYVCFCNENLFL
jgi:hypothetical protein